MALPDPTPPESINVLSDEEVQYWSAQLGVTEQQLRNAVFMEGPLLHNVRAWLQQHGHSGS